MRSYTDLVSIVVPVFGVEAYIEQSLLSLVGQEYRDIEVIIVNDGTRDNSISIAKCALESSGLHYRIIEQGNTGLAAARNSGILYCRGNYICFIDPDDIIAPSHISLLVDCIEKHNLPVAFSDIEYTTSKNRAGNHDDNTGMQIYDCSELLLLLSTRKPVIHCCSLLIRKQCLFNIEFNEELRYGEDIDFMTRLFSSVEKAGRIKRKTYKYLQRCGSLTNTLDINKGVVLIDEFGQTIKKLSNEKPNLSKYYELIYYRLLLGWANVMARTSSKKVFYECKEMLPIEDISNSMTSIPDIKVQIAAKILKYDANLFYKMHNLSIGGNRF